MRRGTYGIKEWSKQDVGGGNLRGRDNLENLGTDERIII